MKPTVTKTMTATPCGRNLVGSRTAARMNHAPIAPRQPMTKRRWRPRNQA
jgi:hypothetical protein